MFHIVIYIYTHIQVSIKVSPNVSQSHSFPVATPHSFTNSEFRVRGTIHKTLVHSFGTTHKNAIHKALHCNNYQILNDVTR